jgi:hypothetical protein
MFLTQAALKISLKIALCATLMAALLPTISHAMRAGDAEARVEVCTAQGSQWVAVERSTDTDGSTPFKAHDSQDCPDCAMQAHSPALPNAPVMGLAPSALQFAMPRLFFLAPRTPHAWAAAQPRAPPRTA